MVVYNISENATQQLIEEATWAITGKGVKVGLLFSEMASLYESLAVKTHTKMYLSLLVLQTELHAQLESFKSQKMFILVSTVMTWAMTKPQNPVSLNKIKESFCLFLCSNQCDHHFSFQVETDVLLIEEEFRRRRPHLAFRNHNNLEKLVLKLGRGVSK